MPHSIESLTLATQRQQRKQIAFSKSPLFLGVLSWRTVFSLHNYHANVNQAKKQKKRFQSYAQTQRTHC